MHISLTITKLHYVTK